MTSPYLLADLRRDEGLRLTAYPDPISGGAPWTIGYGHAGPDVKPGMTWSLEEAETTLGTDVAAKKAQLDEALPWWRALDPIRQDVIVNLAFNLGVHGLCEFHNFLRFMQIGKWTAAALDLHGTAWAKEVGDRATRLIAEVRTGAHQP